MSKASGIKPWYDTYHWTCPANRECGDCQIYPCSCRIDLQLNRVWFDMFTENWYSGSYSGRSLAIWWIRTLRSGYNSVFLLDEADHNSDISYPWYSWPNMLLKLSEESKPCSSRQQHTTRHRIRTLTKSLLKRIRCGRTLSIRLLYFVVINDFNLQKAEDRWYLSSRTGIMPIWIVKILYVMSWDR